MEDLEITCEKCGSALTIVKEYPDGWKYKVTVEPCLDCVEEAAQQSAQRTALPLACGCNPVIGVVCETHAAFVNRRR